MSATYTSAGYYRVSTRPSPYNMGKSIGTSRR
jgi:hypothetical protein